VVLVQVQRLAQARVREGAVVARVLRKHTPRDRSLHYLWSGPTRGQLSDCQAPLREIIEWELRMHCPWAACRA
jgi:hypothetical protein